METQKIGKCIMVIGRRHAGKSPLAKEKAQGWEKKLVYDIRGEYDDTWQKFTVKEDFLARAEETTNTYIVFEEADTIMDGYNKQDYLDFVTGIEHNCNVAIFLFHTIKLAPQYLIDLCDMLILFDVGDNPDDVRRKDKRFLPYIEYPAKPVYIDLHNKDMW